MVGCKLRTLKDAPFFRLFMKISSLARVWAFFGKKQDLCIYFIVNLHIHTNASFLLVLWDPIRADR